MSKFEFYTRSGNIVWYRCLNCGALQRGTPPPVCPICEDHIIKRDEPSAESRADEALNRLNAVLEKYR